MGLINFSLGDIGSVIKDVREAITGKGIEDPNKKAEIELKLNQLEQSLKQGQIQINANEAKSTNWFVAGARPSIIWICGAVLALAYIPKAIVLTAMWTLQVYVMIKGEDSGHIQQIMQSLPPFPDLGSGGVITLLGSLLGLGGLRTFEKIKRVNGNHA